ncbi:eIF-2-alpha kinase activator GCN1 isoform X1 [Prunus yedoensis var. nudiflora]|uniref:eIF-2-alpha kinase activator GCN1 isoform X1 n=1 Tax=Prunus yedoensis var. nudiflora TaxID=2094558 RepID=A0A314Z8M0_PRUYE|nr:eIF-2-alpha kinase activator GCN1 isoform X1 [Prunus yedoensis var. nudiflora]
MLLAMHLCFWTGWQRKLDPEYNVMQTLLLKADWAKSLSYTTEGLMAPYIRRFPEGLLSSEQGVYIAESVAAKNMKQAKGRFRMYDGGDHGGSNHSAKVEPTNGCTDKGRTAKEEARELQLRRRHPYVRGSEKNRKIYLPY